MASRVTHRLSVVQQHLSPEEQNNNSQLCCSPTSASQKSPNDVVVVAAVRTPIGRAKRGSFKDTAPDNLLTPAIKHLLETNPSVNPTEIGDVCIGTVLPPGAQGATEVRIAAFLAGLPENVPCYTVNRQCSSGLQAIANVVNGIKTGQYDVAIAGGVESMSINKMGWDGAVNPEALAHKSAKSCYLAMGQTSENVAERFNVSREKQDQLAVRSHALADAALKNGVFRDEIVPVTTKIVDPKSGEEKVVTVSQDEGVRPGTSLQQLGKLRAVFKDGGSTTAGNASQISDGAAAVLLARRSYAERKGLPVLGVFRSFAAVGVDPAVMGIGPAEAIPAALKKAGLTLSDIDLYEINEAFASQAVYCVEKLGIPLDKVNVNGGAIALGHPLGCTGSRMTATLLHEMKRRQSRYGVVSMCIGTGMGAAAVYEREQ